MKEYIMTKAILARLKGTRSTVACYRCRKQIKEGDVIIVRESGSRDHKILRHKKCEEALYI